jgi:hypothetical protein
LSFINQINNPPRLFCIEKRGGKSWQKLK